MEDPDAKRSRPLGVTLFSILFVVAGTTGLLISALSALAPPGKGDALMLEIGFSPGVHSAYSAFLYLLGSLGGAGLWAGRRWAWYLSAGLLVVQLENLVGAWWLLSRVEPLLSPEEAQVFSVVAGILIGVAAIPCLLCLGYFFRKRVGAYFRLEPGRRWIRLASLAVAALPLPTLWLTLGS